MKQIKDDIIKALKTVYDPELPVNIWDLGLVYDISIKPEEVILKMTFTSPTCPVMEDLLMQVKSAVENVVKRNVVTDLVWNPPWDISRMSETAKIELDLINHGW